MTSSLNPILELANTINDMVDRLGVFADGWVQVTGDVKSGDVVVVAQ